jgi:hypothetical protein
MVCEFPGVGQDSVIKAEGEAVSMMWGKHYASTYEGSMVGSGAAVFAVWGYVISKMQGDKEVGAQVELNPKLLAFVIGEPEPVIEAAISKLCAKDLNSRSKDEEGRRLVKIGQFAYRVVNGPKYLGIKNLDEKRAGDRERKRKQRAKPSGNGAPLAGEKAYERILETEGQAAADKFMESMSPRAMEADTTTAGLLEINATKNIPPVQEPASPLDLPEGETQEG